MKIFLICLFFLIHNWGYSQSITEDQVIPIPNTVSDISNEQLSEITKMIGDAKIIGTTERIHGYEEPFVFRNEFIKYLVENKRIDVILLESGLLDSRFLNDYVHNRISDLDTARIYGFTSGKHLIVKNIELLEWLRQYNLKASNSHKVSLFGFDVSGSMGAGSSQSNMNTPLLTSLSYFKTLSKPVNSNFIERLHAHVEFVNTKPFGPKDEGLKTYEDLSIDIRNEITAYINELISNLHTNRFNYIQQTSKEDYEWAVVAAHAARQIDNILRELPLPGEPFSEEKIDNSFFSRLNAMSENLQFLLNTHTEANFLIFAASNHLFKSKVETYWPNNPDPVILPITAGQYLADQYPNDYKLISHFYLEAPNKRDNLSEKEGYFSSLLTNGDQNYFGPVSVISDMKTSKEIQIDDQNYLTPKEAFDFVLFTKKLSQLERIEK